MPVVIIILLNPLPVLVALKILREMLSFTHLVHDKYLSARWASRKLRPKSKTIACLPRIASSYREPLLTKVVDIIFKIQFLG